MPKYLMEVCYTADGVKGVRREGGSARREVAVRALESVGGKVEALYFAFGDVDVYCIVETPDESRAVAISMAINQSGLATARLIPLIAPETVDAATKITSTYRGPGQS